jgi:hypothetical protein
MKKTIVTLIVLPFYFISFAAGVNDAPSLSSRSGFIISGVVTAGVILMIALASGPNKNNDNHID